MRSILSFLISFLIVAPSWGQMYDPVKWSFNVDVVNENEVDLVIHADIEEGWYVYSQDAGDGPISTSFAFLMRRALTAMIFTMPAAPLCAQPGCCAPL